MTLPRVPSFVAWRSAAAVRRSPGRRRRMRKPRPIALAPHRAVYDLKLAQHARQARR